jgi:hypothetical protein
MEKFGEMFKERIGNWSHMVAVLILLMHSLRLLFLSFNSGFYWPTFATGLVYFTLALLMFWYGWIPTLVATILLSIDFISYFLGFDSLTIFKNLVFIVLLIDLYELWKKRKEKNQKKHRKRE